MRVVGERVVGEGLVAVRTFETSTSSVTAQTQAQFWHNLMRTSELETGFSAGQTFNDAETCF